MTINEMVEYISETLNSPSQETKTRIAHEINMRYRQVSSAIGLPTIKREEVSATATVGSRFLTFLGTERIDAVFRKIGATPQIVPLKEITESEMNEMTARGEPATKYSIYSTDAQSVTIRVDCKPTTTFTLYAQVIGDATSLTGNNQPAFPESFHDILVHGVLADEYRRKEKTDLARDAEIMFQQRLSDLRMFMAKSAFIDIYRGKNFGGNGWWDYETKKY